MYKFKTKYLNFKGIVICLLTLILIGFSYNVMKPKEKIIASLNTFEGKQMLSYVKDNKLYFINSKGKSIFLYDKVFQDGKESEDDKRSEIEKLASSIAYVKQPYLVFTQKDTGIYFLGDIKVETNSGTLYRYDEDKGIKKIDEQVKLPIYISPDCNKMAYSKINGKIVNGQILSDLYICETGKASIKILENCSESVGYNLIDYNFSWSTNTVSYTEYDIENNTVKIYVKEQFKDKELVDEGIGMPPNYYSDDGTIIAYRKINSDASEYYIKKSGKKSEHIIESDYFQLIPADFSAYYIGEYDKPKVSGNLYYKELDKAPVKIAADVKNIFFEGNHYNYKEYIKLIEQRRILFQKKDGMVFLVNEKKAPQKVVNLEDDEDIIFDEATTDFLIIPKEEGKIKRGIYNKATRNYTINDIDDNVAVLNQGNIFESNKLFYLKKSINKDNEFWSLDLTNNTKELIQTFPEKLEQLIEQSVVMPTMSLNEFKTLVSAQVIGNTLYYSFNNGLKKEIYVKKVNSKPIKIAEENGDYLVYDEDTIYYWGIAGNLHDVGNETYDLYVYRYGKSPELVASEISIEY